MMASIQEIVVLVIIIGTAVAIMAVAGWVVAILIGGVGDLRRWRRRRRD